MPRLIHTNSTNSLSQPGEDWWLNLSPPPLWSHDMACHGLRPSWTFMISQNVWAKHEHICKMGPYDSIWSGIIIFWIFLGCPPLSRSLSIQKGTVGETTQNCTNIENYENILEQKLFGPGPLCLLCPYVCGALGPSVCPLRPWARQVHVHLYIAARSMLQVFSTQIPRSNHYCWTEFSFCMCFTMFSEALRTLRTDN